MLQKSWLISWRILLTILVLSWTCQAHTVEQFYAELHQSENQAQLELQFDLGYALPAMRAEPDLPQPTRDWLLSQSPEEHAKLRRGSENYLRECLSFTKNGQGITAQYHFPDFETSPHPFLKPLMNGAYYRVIITPKSPSPHQDLELHLSSGKRPDLVIKIPQTKGEDEYLTVKPGDSFLIQQAKGSSYQLSALKTGFQHVIPFGLDHLLFIISLFLCQRAFRPLLWQSLAFTAAHTLSLGLSAASIIPPTGPWIEILIPFSIAAVAIENLRNSPLLRGRIVIVFIFGLIHGLGFAGALQKLLPADDTFVPFLLLTNLGIEAAQVVVLITAWIITIPFMKKPQYESWRKGVNIALLILALAWTLQRLIEVYGR
ncbi:HupE/UreJ family protein [Akkermansiaceae bacterium]|nr:HupE/UreJ family protein [Akkermansiaceae bacterium]